MTMPTVIPKASYSTIAYNMADARNTLNFSNYFLWDNVYTVVNLNYIDPEVDLLYVMNNSYQSNVTSAQIPQNYLDAVRGLQAHIARRTGFVAQPTNPAGSQTIIDQYLIANSYGSAIKVPPAFATMSGLVGYPISSQNILSSDPVVPNPPAVLP